MRSFYFRPHPVLSLITLIGLVVLIKLGMWQKQRLEWKTELLASVEAAANAAPLTSLEQIETALENGDFTEFRRVDIPAELLAMDAPFFVYTARNRDVSWRRFQLAKSLGRIVFADVGLVSDALREKRRVEPQAIRLIGYVRTASKQETPRSQSSPERNRWFGFNPLPETHDWAKLSGVDADMRFFIETVPDVTSGEGLVPKRPEIANNHFEYMLTWFSFAIIGLIFYILIHIRDGRAGRRKSGD